MMGADATAFVNNINEAVPPLVDVAAWSHLMIERDGIARGWSVFMADRPLLLSPTWTQIPFELALTRPRRLERRRPKN
jgi:amidase